MPQVKIKQIRGLESTLNALSGVTTIKETVSTNAGSGATGFKLAYDAREINGILVYVNGMKVETFSWVDGNGTTISTTLIPAQSELVWDSINAGYDLSSSDIIEIIYETLAGGAIAFDSNGNYSDSGSGSVGPQGATGAQGAIGPQGPSGSGGSGNISGTVDGHLIPDTNVAYDLGNAEYKFRHLYLSGNTLYMGGQPLSIDNGQLTLNGNPVTGSTDTYNSTKASEDQLTSSTILSTTNTNDYQNLGGVLSPNLDRFLTLDGDVIKVFRLTNSVWQQEGSDIHGTLGSITFNSGTRKWSKDGTHFIIVSPQNGSYTLATVYYWDGSDWAIKGNQIDSDTKNGDIATFPEGLDINHDGTRIAIQWDLPSPTDSALDEFITVYNWNSNSNQWDKSGQQINPAKYFSMDNAGGYMIYDSDEHSAFDRELYMAKIRATGDFGAYPNTNFAMIYNGNPDGHYSNNTSTTSGSSNLVRRGEFSGNDNYVSYSYQPNSIGFLIKVPDSDGIENWWRDSTLYANDLIPTPAYIYSFCHNNDATRTMVHHVSSGVNYWSIWDKTGTPLTNPFDTWTKVLGPIASASSTGFSANSDLTKVMSEISTDTYVLYNIPASLPVNSVSANRILDMTTLSVGSQFELQFDEGLAYAAVQTCHVYIDYNNRIHARVVSNDANTNTLTLEVIELVGGGISDEYTITLG